MGSKAVKNAHVEVYKPDNDSFKVADSDFTIPASDIASVSSSARLSEEKDSATFEIHNNSGQYSNNASTPIRSGQRVVFWLTTEDEITAWGDGAWGDGSWGGERLHWTGLIRDVSFQYAGPNKSYISFKAEDFVFGVMSQRLLFDSFQSQGLAGSSSSILNTALSNEAPEIDRSKIEDFTSTTTSVTADGTNLLEFSIKLMKRVDACMFARRDRLHFKNFNNISKKFDLKGSDIGYFELKQDDSNLVNSVRVDGGKDIAIDDEQPNQSNWTTVTDSSRSQLQLSTRKSEIDEVEIHTDPTRTGSQESLTVRLQKDDGGSPIAPGDTTSDIASKSLSYEFLAEDGLTTFLMPDHTLPEPDPWLIIESDGSTGQDIGTDGSSNVTYKAYYGYKVTVRQVDKTSRDKYRKRETRIKDDTVRSSSEARDVAQEKINHDTVPEEQVAMEAESQSAFYLRVGEVFNMNFPRESATGNFIVTERRDELQDNQLVTEITAQEISSV